GRFTPWRIDRVRFVNGEFRQPLIRLGGHMPGRPRGIQQRSLHRNESRCVPGSGRALRRGRAEAEREKGGEQKRASHGSYQVTGILVRVRVVMAPGPALSTAIA